MPRPQHSSKKATIKSKPKASTLTAPLRAELLTLPLELRQEIYNQLVLDSYASLLKLLVVSRPMSKEVKPFLYRRPFFFDGQAQLYDWLGEVDHAFLRHVFDIRFKLHDIDPETIIGALGKRLRKAEAQNHDLEEDDNPYYEACFVDLKRLQKAFSLFTGLRSFTIVACNATDPQPPARMKDSFSKMLGFCLRDVQELVSEEALFPIDFVANKPKLRRLRFPANTESDEEDTAAIFGKLPNLRLEICRVQPTRDFEYEYGCMPELLPHVPPLHSLTLFEKVKSEELLEEIFIHSHDAMKRHLKSLRRMTLLVRMPPPRSDLEKGIQRNLFLFMQASNLQHFEMTQDFLAGFPTFLPRTLETFVLRLDTWNEPEGSRRYFHLMCQLRRIFGHEPEASGVPQRLSKLREIQVWVRDDPVNLGSEDSDSDAEDSYDLARIFSRAKADVEKLGLAFKVVINGTGNGEFPLSRHIS